jgi:hypothetical protein
VGLNVENQDYRFHLLQGNSLARQFRAIDGIWLHPCSRLNAELSLHCFTLSSMKIESRLADGDESVHSVCNE